MGSRIGKKYIHTDDIFLSLVVAALTVLAGVILSPVLLNRLGASFKINWSRLADIAQAYEGAVSLLTIVTFAGVIFSLFVQVQERRSNRLQALRTFHLNLMQVALQDPAYFRTWSGMPGASPNKMREVGFINMFVWFLQLRWELGDLDERGLRGIVANELFVSEASRDYWRAYRERLIYSRSQSRRQRQYVEVIEGEFQRAEAEGAAAIPSSDNISAAEKRKKMKGAAIGVSSIIVGIVVVASCRSIRR